MDDEAAYCNYRMRYAYGLVMKSRGQKELRRSLWETRGWSFFGGKYLENVTQHAHTFLCHLKEASFEPFGVTAQEGRHTWVTGLCIPRVYKSSFMLAETVII